METANDQEAVLLREALKRTSGRERELFLDQACAGDAPLRARLAALLGAKERPDPHREVPQVPAATMKVVIPDQHDTVDDLCNLYLVSAAEGSYERPVYPAEDASFNGRN